MAEILVTEADGASYDVSVSEGASVSTHIVEATEDDLIGLGIADHDRRAVVEESMRFLLEREPKESIMARFGLRTISGFFPDYPDVIRRRMRGELD